MARIMVVEDDVYMREELTDLLRKSGYETASLFDFENAIPEISRIRCCSAKRKHSPSSFNLKIRKESKSWHL